MHKGRFRWMLGCMAVAFGLPLCGWGQLAPAKDPLPVETQLVLHMQDLERSWEVQQARASQARSPIALGLSGLPNDDELRGQLSSIQGEFRFDLYPKVKEYIKLYAEQQREHLQALLGMDEAYRGVIERSLQQMGLPNNLRHLPMAMSAMNVCAVAEHGTAGLWQLNYHTAIRYGLHCSQEVDERRDLHRSTGAALAYLKDLNRQYGDWMVTLAAFACGPGGVTRAQIRAGGKKGFGELYPHLPTHSRDYVPAFVAACYVARHSQSLGVDKLAVNGNLNPDRIQLQGPLGFKSVAKVLKIPEDQLRALNPVCRMEMIPGIDVPVQLCLPRGYGARFSEMRDSIYAVNHRMEQAKLPAKPVTVEAEEVGGSGEEAGDPAEGPAVRPEDEGKGAEWAPPPGTVPLKYVIKAGDNLGSIAQRFGVSITQLMQANRLKSHNIRAGDALQIYVPKAKVKDYQYLVAGPSGTVATQVPGKESPTKQGDYEYYTVKSGDNLWLISKKYPGVTDKEIMELNGIGENIQPGMRLKIPRKKP